MKYSNPEIPEGINVSDSHPLKEFALLLAVVLLAVVLITTLLAYSVDWLAEYVPYEYESRIAQTFMTDTSQQGPVDDYLQGLANDIVKHMDLAEGMNISVHYVNEDVVNAMATLGGHVFIYRGLLEKLPHENALVMLLGHEIGHIKLRHPIKGLGKGVVIGMALAALLGQSADVASGLLTDASTLTLLNFSREQEEHADIEGLYVTHRFYQHVQGADDLFKVLLHEHDEQGVYVPQIMSSHPDTQYRVSQISALANDKHWLARGLLKPIPQAVKSKLIADAKQVKEAD